MKKKYIIEVLEDKKSALVMYEKKTPLIKHIISTLKKTHHVYEETNHKQKQYSYKKYNLAVFLNIFPQPAQLEICKLPIFIFFDRQEYYQQKKRWCEKRLKHYKIVNIGRVNRPLIELVEFILFKTPTPYVFNFSAKVIPRPLVRPPEMSMRQLIIRTAFFITFSVVALNMIFLAVFAYQVFLLNTLLKQGVEELPKIKKTIAAITTAEQMSKKLVIIPQNTLFWIPGIDGFLGFVGTVDKTSLLVVNGFDVVENYARLAKLFVTKSKTDAEKQEVVLRINYINKHFSEVGSSYYEAVSRWKNTNMLFLNKRKERILTQFEYLDDYFSVFEELNKEIEFLLGSSGKRTYLLLFMNNMELRPGGGFIGSVGVLDFADFSLKELKVYDVYALDGQLRAHFDPPEAIRKYLNQPHFFLRDSSFSPDFTTNVETALDLIKTEVGWKDFDGVVGVTFSAVQQIVGAFSDFHVTSYDEKITPDNFFIKAQLYAEKDFFPGSHGKQNFLEAVLRTLVVKFDEGGFDYWIFAQKLKKVLEEKFVAFYFSKPEVQSAFDRLFWTGRIVKPGCNIADDCFFDYLLVTDANLGVNKANFFVQRSLRLYTKVNSQRRVSNTLILDYKNESLENIFPGGRYKNYVQIYLPNNITIQKVNVNGSPAYYAEEPEYGLKKIGFLFEVLPQEQTTAVVEYVFADKLDKRLNYQLIVQKQIGSINNDFTYEISTDEGLDVFNTNFNPIVEDGRFVYNTFLERDRLLLVSFK